MFKAAAMNQVFIEIVDAYKPQIVISDDAVETAKASQDPLQSIAEHLSTLGVDFQGVSPSQWADHCSIQLKSLIDGIDAFLHQVRRDTKVCSFSATNDSILMWSHYADNHRGFCIEYNLEPLVPKHPFRNNLYPIIYSPELYNPMPWLKSLMDPDRQQFNQIHPLMALIRKFDGWAYEQEWRLILFSPSPTEDYDLKVPAPVRVFLGSRMGSTNKNELRAICEERGIELWQMQLAGDKYELFAERQH